MLATVVVFDRNGGFIQHETTDQKTKFSQVDSVYRLKVGLAEASPGQVDWIRTKCKIMTNMWLLAQIRESARKLYEDLDNDTFMDFAGELIREELPSGEADQRSQGGNLAVGP